MELTLPGKKVFGSIYVCCNCGDYLNSKRKYCDYCKTPGQRKKMNKENAEHLGLTQDEWQKERLKMRSFSRKVSFNKSSK